MPSKDLRSEPFDSSTIAKLEIFQDYAQAWIPTFVMQGRSEVHIFDFFAGTGYDKVGVKGSPIRILNEIKSQVGNAFQKGSRIHVHLNEFEPNKSTQHKFDLLSESCKEYLANNNDVDRAITLNLYNEDCETLFPKLYPQLKEYPSLVYLDQNGIKFLSEKYISKLEQCRETDFLYFVSSSYFWRFANHDSFKTHFDLDIEEAKKDPYRFIHINVLRQLKEKLGDQSPLKLYPFTLEKGPNIHGIIFGASHAKAVDKFLSISWGKNKLNGEANFDIHNDTPKAQRSLFGEKLNKVQLFKQRVKRKILDQSITNNYQLYHFCLDNGHIGTHGAECLREMKKGKELTYDCTSPLVTYDNVYKKFRKLEYKLTK